MTIGPAPMMRIEEMSVRLGILGSALREIHVDEDGLEAVAARPLRDADALFRSRALADSEQQLLLFLVLDQFAKRHAAACSDGVELRLAVHLRRHAAGKTDQ